MIVPRLSCELPGIHTVGIHDPNMANSALLSNKGNTFAVGRIHGIALVVLIAGKPLKGRAIRFDPI
jgi:hypothetical protein